LFPIPLGVTNKIERNFKEISYGVV
jgi:hypothetical protein